MGDVTPPGWEQALSLAWALENVADLESTEAVRATCEVLGIERDHWPTYIADGSWFVGDGHGYGRERIESSWNERFSRRTNVWLDEDAWHAPLWQLWLPEPKMVFAANLAYLIRLRGRGTVVRLARFIGRDKNTGSRWARWREEGQKVRVPPSTSVPRILEFFGLRPTCDLFREPLFLGRADIQDDLARIEGRHYLDCLAGDHLRQAVDRLREESARQAARKNDTGWTPTSRS